MNKVINPFTPGAVIMPNGEIITMNNKNHAPFFQDILKREFEKIGVNAIEIQNEDNLARLSSLLLKQLQILPYQGCSSGDRKYHGGMLFINSVDQLTDEQLSTIIDFYSHVSAKYQMDIWQTSFDDCNDKIISLGELYEEILNRSTKNK